MFAESTFHPLDASKIQKLYFQTKNAFRITISFGQNLSLPRDPERPEVMYWAASYLGIPKDDH